MTKTTRQVQAENRRAQLISVTRDLFVDRGSERVTVADVATRAGVAPGLLYHYFSDRDALLRAVLDEAIPRELYAELAAGLSGTPVAIGLRAFVSRVANIMAGRGDLLRALFREMLTPGSPVPAGVAALQGVVLTELGAYLQERIDAGELRPHDPRVPLRLLMSGVLVLGVTGQPVEAWVDEFVDTVLAGIQA